MKKKPRVVILVPPRRGLENQNEASNDTYIAANAVEKALKAKGYEAGQLQVNLQCHPERSEGSSNGRFTNQPPADLLVRQDNRMGPSASPTPFCCRNFGRSLPSSEAKGPQNDVIFNLCEDFEGRGEGEAYVAGLLELFELPYTGSPPESLLCCLHKDQAKQILAARGLPTPSGFLLSRPQLNGERVRYPAMVKPAREDASLGISAASVVPNKPALQARLAALQKEKLFPVLVEEFIDGREINVSILGDQVLPLSEIDFSAESDPLKRILTYEAKWEERSAAYRRSAPICPAKVDLATRKKLERLALEAFTALRCRDYARVDFRLRSDGEPFILEVNPNPCLAPDAGFARSARAAGNSYEELIEKILQFAIFRHSERSEESPMEYPSLRSG